MKEKDKRELTSYEIAIQNRSYIQYILGLIIRWKQHFKYAIAVRIARRKGATIGEGVIMPISLAKKANRNLNIGNHVSIQTNAIDLRNKVTIGSHVIIGSQSEIITTSHHIDSLDYEQKNYGIRIDDYVWIPTKVLILPSCRHIGYGAIVGSGSVVANDIDEMSVVSGNPAKEFKKRKHVHQNLVVESLLGGDYHVYKKSRKRK
jgi:maltose O-acetyltransferase